MKPTKLVPLLSLALMTLPAKAQYPDQFYTDGEKIDGWKREGDRKTTMWFARRPGEQIAFEQSQVIVFDDDPEYAYYVNLGTKKFVGRYSFTGRLFAAGRGGPARRDRRYPAKRVSAAWRITGSTRVDA